MSLLKSEALKAALALFMPLAALAAGAGAGAAPPDSAQVVEPRLLSPAVKRQVAALAAAQSAATAAAATAPAAQARAAALLRQARIDGDPRLLGYAEAALRPWAERPDAPIGIAVLMATVEQSQHRFDASRHRLERALARDASSLQGWLTLSTVRLVRGDLDGAQAACGRVSALDADVGRLCGLQVTVLTADAATALPPLRELARLPRADLAAWAASLAGETAMRLGQPREGLRWLAQAALGSTDLYDRLALVDGHLANGNWPAAAQALDGLPQTDAVLLRQLRVASRTPADAAGAAPAAQALRERLQARFADVPDDEARLHARERALFHLWSDEPAAARDWAAINLALQKEPIDLRIAAEAARGAGDTALRDQVLAHVRRTGLQDQRLQAALQSTPTPVNPAWTTP